MRKEQIGKVFPNLKKTLAYYSPTSFYITLNTITEAEFNNLLSTKGDKGEVEKLSVFLHETRHNIDHLSTLWGQNHILKLYKAINARLGRNEFKFHEILPLKIAEQQFHYETYYSYESNVVPWRNMDDNWIWKFSSGIKFDMNGNPDENNPILFINFLTRQQVHLIRVPLSIAALLETSAIRDELICIYNYINSLEEDQKIVENKLQNEKVFSEIIYNQKLAVYNSIVHLTATVLELNDVLVALNISSFIATLALNLPIEVVIRIPINKEALEVWKSRATRMMENQEYGFIFYNLLYNYRDIFLKTGSYNIEELLKSNSLLSSGQLNQLIEEKFDSILEEIKSKESLKTNFTDLLNEGRRLFKLRGIDGSLLETIDILKNHNFKPNVICTDTDFELEDYVPSKIRLPIDKLSFQQWYSFSMMIDARLDEFFFVRGL